MSDGKRPGAMSALRAPLLLLLLAAGPSAGLAQSSPPTGLPPGVYMGEPDYKQATAGTYALDPDHASVIARVSHLGYSYSIFRFERLGATLGWDPANTAAGSLSAKVETASITSNVKGFGDQLAGDEFLKSKAFPEATFTSTAFRQTSARGGKVEGQLSLMGKTHPVTFDVELVGAGKGFAGQPRMGMNAHTSINPVDFGLPPLLGDAIEIVVDAEFQRNP
jgi:polyisoprenoid-binding protein YceI